MIDIATCFGANLLRLRSRAGISQEQLSYRAGLHRTEISQLERGLRIPRIDTLMKLAAGLDATYDDLLLGIAWPPGDVQMGHFSERRDSAS